MPAATYAMEIEQGATYRLSFLYGKDSGTLDEAGKPIYTPYDLTNCSARMQVRARVDEVDTVVLQASTDDGRIVLQEGGELGWISLHFPAEATEELTVKRGKYDIELVWPSGDVTRVLAGSVTFIPNITR